MKDIILSPELKFIKYNTYQIKVIVIKTITSIHYKQL